MPMFFRRRPRRRSRCLTGYLALGLVLLAAPAGAATPTDAALARQLQARLGTPAAAGCRVTPCPHFPGALRAFYRQRSFRPAWVRQGRVSREAIRMRELVRGADTEGLDPADYHLDAIDAHLAALLGAGPGGDRPTAALETELLLTDAFLALADHLADGRIDPRRIDPNQRPPPDTSPPIEALHTALVTGQLAETLAGLRPQAREYALLREALLRYQRLAKLGGWEAIPAGEALAQGHAGPRTARLRERLAATGDLDSASGSPVFDASVLAGVEAFQRRHGLEPDGVVGEQTRRALNVGAARRARQIAANMERWRWLPRSLGQRHIRVNIANYRLEALEDGRRALEMPVIVGRPYRRTPVFSDRVRYLVLNPSWYVPPTIAREDLLPKIKADPSHLVQQNLTVLARHEGRLERVDPATVEWGSVDPAAIPYVLRQEPGPRNALGRIKFMFPNPYDVYLHDTPDTGLFAQRTRSFSSGCIRLGDPLALAEYVMRGDPAWDRAAIAVAIQTGRTQRLSLPEPVPIHVVYWTAWVDDEGTVQFRADPYDRDPILMNALAAPTKPPAGAAAGDALYNVASP